MPVPWFRVCLTVIFSVSFTLSMVYIPSDVQGIILKIILFLNVLLWLVLSLRSRRQP